MSKLEDRSLNPLAQQARDGVRANLESGLPVSVTGIDGVEVELPAAAAESLLEVLSVLSEGKAVHVVAHESELSTVEAAELLNVSRPYLIKLAESGIIPFRKVGKHRRLRFADVMAYKTQTMCDRSAALDELVTQAQTLDMGY